VHVGGFGDDRMDQAGVLSRPIWTFIPSYHWLPFLIWCISGSRYPSLFLVELGNLCTTLVPEHGSDSAHCVSSGKAAKTEVIQSYPRSTKGMLIICFTNLVVAFLNLGI
jgi:hypothetical protein